MTTTLVCFALKEEAGAFQRATESRADVSVFITGIGRANAGKNVRAFLAKNSPALVLSCGFAGGLNPELALGTVVFSTGDAVLSEKLTAAGAKPAKFVCTQTIASTVAQKKQLRRTSKADAVEMESEAIYIVCRERSIPCAAVRAISDTANEDLPLDFNKLSKPDSNLDFGKLAVALIKQPWKIPALLRLQKNCSYAATQLADVLNRVIQ